MLKKSRSSLAAGKQVAASRLYLDEPEFRCVLGVIIEKRFVGSGGTVENRK